MLVWQRAAGRIPRFAYANRPRNFPQNNKQTTSTDHAPKGAELLSSRAERLMVQQGMDATRPWLVVSDDPGEDTAPHPRSRPGSRRATPN